MYDNAGNYSCLSAIDGYDIDSPTAYIYNVTGNTSGWTNKDVTLKVNALDINGDLQYSFDNGVTWQTSNEKTFTSASKGIIVKVKNGLGNITQYKNSFDIYVDKEAPQSPVLYEDDGLYNILSYADKTPENMTSPVTLQYKIGESGEWKNYTSEFSVPGLDEIKLYARSIDTAGNISGTSTLTVKKRIGEYAENITDLNLGDFGFFNIERMYSSKNNKWQFSFDSHLEDYYYSVVGSNTQLKANNIKKFITPDGKEDIFILQSDGTYKSQQTNSTLVVYEDQFVMTNGDIIYTFNTNNQLISIEDNNSNCIEFTRSEDGNLLTISDQLGRSCNIEYLNGNPIQIVDPLNREVNYNWTEGNLTSVTDQTGKTINYNYTNNKLTTSYDKSIQYDPNGRLSKITQKNQSFVSYVYNDSNKEIVMTDSSGNTEKTVYDDAMRISRQIDTDNNKKEYYYDKNNNVNKIIYSVFENNAFVVSGSDTFVYDDNNNLIEESKADETKTYYQYNDFNKVNVKAVRKEGVEPTEEQIKNLSGDAFYLTFYQYDANGNQSIVAEMKEGTKPTNTQCATLDTAIFEKTLYSYNGDGTLYKVNYVNKNRTEKYTYNGYKHATSMTTTITENSRTTSKTAKYQYDIIGQLLSQTTEEGKINTYVYDLYGEKVRETLDGKTSRYVYDNNGLLIQHIDYDNYNNVDDGLNQSPLNYGYSNKDVGHRYTYNTLGNLVSETDKYDRTTNYEYDSTGNMTSQKFNIYEIDYNKFGNTTNIKLGDKNLISYDYSSDLKQLLKSNYANGQVVEYIYQNENLKAIKYDGSTTNAFEYSYNETGDLTQKIDNINNTKTKFEDDKVTESRKNTDGTYTDIHSYETKTVDDIKNFVETVNGKTYTSVWLENNDKFVLNDTSSLNKAYTLNAYDKVVATNVYMKTNDVSSNILSTSIALPVANEDKISNITHTYGGKTTSFGYTYDDKGNITSVTQNGIITRYKYDKLNQLVRVDDTAQNKTFTYTYNTSGNILSKSEYALTAAEVEPTNPVSTINYGYDDATWPDKLTSYNGQAITYDANGNPLNFDGWTYVWQAGRQLKRMTKNGSTIDYKYDDKGIRTSKTVNGVTTNYTTIDGRITSQSDGTNSLYFRYDSNDELVGTQINGTEYIYLKNLQGDIISILDTKGQSVVDYTYDEWGKVVSITGSMADSIGKLNPMRYRSYYLDNETGYYYLQSRYYDCGIGRFINADEAGILELTKGEAVGHNLFAYCGNDPVNKIDIDGHFSLKVVLVAGIAGGLWNLGKYIFRNWRRFSLKSAFLEFAKGFLTGAILGALVQLPDALKAALLGAVVEAMGYIGTCIHQKKTPSAGTVLNKALVGASYGILSNGVAKIADKMKIGIPKSNPGFVYVAAIAFIRGFTKGYLSDFFSLR